jgi:hypothetical protein
MLLSSEGEHSVEEQNKVFKAIARFPDEVAYVGRRDWKKRT